MCGIHINCRHFAGKGKCTHQAAPRSWFGATLCILVDRPADPRIAFRCALQEGVPAPMIFAKRGQSC